MNANEALGALKKYFGYASFRPLQQEIIEGVYAGQSSLVLMPTGGGKSICFQIPALTMAGTVVVVSPLISLMKDQVDGLVANGIAAAYLNSSMDEAEATAVAYDYEAGKLKLLYVSPERLLSAGFFQFLRRSQVSLFAIDEAHCISAWGHDFRPEYTKLKSIRESFPSTPILALTATADRLTRLDICEQLSIADDHQYVASFDRPNLSLEVRPGRQRRQQIVQFLKQHPNQPGIIYCLSRKQTENLAGKLREAGFNAAAYHAGLKAEVRSQVQADFVKDAIEIVCATIAFGMGIDKSNVRWVIHYTMPKNLENYYQEIGRSGRDGSTADTLLFYSYQDYTTLQDMLSGGDNSEVQLAKLNRMKEYAEALACRRRILLNYFSEDMGEDCGNCDICLNPPERFDGTILAQKALSAVARLEQNVGVGTVIDVLRGSQSQNILRNGYQHLKTYGAGHDVSLYDWNYYFGQLLNLGYVYLAHEDFNKLKLAPAARRVLFEKEKVELVRFKTLKERREQEDAKSKSLAKSANPRLRDGLFEHLRKLRLRMSREMGLPPYNIFNDRTLEEMSAVKPVTELELSRINGVGEHKLYKYGDAFIDAICEHEGISRQGSRISEREAPDSRPRSTGAKGQKSIAETVKLFQAGHEVEEVAAQRRMSPSTIIGHLSKAYQAGTEVDILRLVDTSIVERVRAAIPPDTGKAGPKLRDLMAHFDEGEISYNELRFAVLYIQREDVE